MWPLRFTSRRVAGLGRPSPAAGSAHSRAALGDDASMTPASRAARQRSLIRQQFRDLNIARRLCAMTFGIGNHSRSPSCFNLNAGMGTFRLSVRRPGDRLTARWISDRSRGRGSDMNRSVLGVPGVDPHQESLRYPARFCRKPWCRLRYGARRLLDRLERCIADGWTRRSRKRAQPTGPPQGRFTNPAFRCPLARTESASGFSVGRRLPIMAEGTRLAAIHDEETIMNILLWYLPYAMFSGACDVVLAEGGTRTGSERRADSAERERETDEPALAA